MRKKNNSLNALRREKQKLEKLLKRKRDAELRKKQKIRNAELNKQKAISEEKKLRKEIAMLRNEKEKNIRYKLSILKAKAKSVTSDPETKRKAKAAYAQWIKFARFMGK